MLEEDADGGACDSSGALVDIGREAWSSVACGARFICSKNQFKGGDHVDRSAAACGSAGDDQRRLVQQRYDAISTLGTSEGEDLPVAVQRLMRR